MNPIVISVGNITLEAELNDSPTAQKVWEALPIEARANVWGDEIYFSIPVKAAEGPDAQEIVAVGDLGYWPPGEAFCIFYGRTPVSTDDRPRAYSPVNPLGRITGDATRLRGVRGGTPVRIIRALVAK
jgi:hypothetical protein